jgi:hypothetical protein
VVNSENKPYQFVITLAVYVSPGIQIDQYDMTIVSGIMDCQIIIICLVRKQQSDLRVYQLTARDRNIVDNTSRFFPN